MSKTKATVEKIAPIKLVLNGGKEILDSATIPIEWHFSDEVIARKPQYIVLCDFEMSRQHLTNERYSSLGRRYLVKVKDLAVYIQLFKPNRHCLVFFVFCGEEKDALRRARAYIKRGEYCYEERVYSDDIDSGYRSEKDVFIAAVEFEVPNELKELFAVKPETGFSRLIWKWVNRWHEYEPIDQCAYRKRMPFAFVFQPPLFLIGRSFAGVFGTIYTLVGAFILVFFGWQPIFFENIRHSWWGIDDFGFNLTKQSYWRFWAKDFGAYETQGKFLPLYLVPYIVVLELLGVGFVGFGLYELFLILKLNLVLSILGLLIFAAILIRLTVKLFSYEKIEKIFAKWREEGKKSNEEKIKAMEKEYLAFLQANTSLKHVPEKVDLPALMKKVDTMTRFRMSFWALKAKVCKPFAR